MNTNTCSKSVHVSRGEKEIKLYDHCLIRHELSVDQCRGGHGFVLKYKIIHFRSVVEFKYLEVERES